MIRCVGPSFEAGAVTFSGHTNIDLPRRTDDGKIIPDAFDSYELKQVGDKWIYELVRADIDSIEDVDDSGERRHA